MHSNFGTALSAPIKTASAVLLLCGLAGCSDSPYQIAPVSGVVTLDGQPLAGAKVRYSPRRQGNSMVAGPGSIGVTDTDGRFKLRTHSGSQGAVVGTHRVSISTYADEMVDPDNSDAVRIISKERIPEKYRLNSNFTVEVPDSGTETANFDLKSE